MARASTVKEDHERNVTVHQVLPVHRPVPDLLLRRLHDKEPGLRPAGELPVNFMFHLIRYAHIADSCVNCGQCEEVCPAEIPNALFMHAQQVELKDVRPRPGCFHGTATHGLCRGETGTGAAENTGSDMISDERVQPGAEVIMV